jgi:hypothetical protein
MNAGEQVALKNAIKSTEHPCKFRPYNLRSDADIKGMCLVPLGIVCHTQNFVQPYKQVGRPSSYSEYLQDRHTNGAGKDIF